MIQNSSRNANRTAVIVLGMHRSGTSLVANLVADQGFALPAHLIGAGKGNSRGHYESKLIVQCSDRLLASTDSDWKDWRSLALPNTTAERNYVSELAEIIKSEYGSAEKIVIKDPRLCRLTEYVESALSELKIQPAFIIPFRHYAAVAASLNDRDGILGDHAIALWLRHVIDAERSTRGKLRAIVSIDQAIVDGGRSVRTALKRLGLVENEESANASVIDQELWHHRNNVDCPGVQLSMTEMASSVLRCIGKLETDPEDILATTELDRIKAVFDETSKILMSRWDRFKDCDDNIRNEVARAQSGLIDLALRVQSERSNLQRLQEDRDALDRLNIALIRDFEDARAANLQLRVEIDRGALDHVRVSEQLAHATIGLATSSATVRALENERTSLLDRLDSQDARFGSIMRDEAGKAFGTVQKLSQRVGELQLAMRLEREKFDASIVEVEQLKSKLESLKVDRARLYEQATGYWAAATEFKTKRASPIAFIREYFGKSVAAELPAPASPSDAPSAHQTTQENSGEALLHLEAIVAAKIFDEN